MQREYSAWNGNKYVHLCMKDHLGIYSENMGTIFLFEQSLCGLVLIVVKTTWVGTGVISSK